MALLSTARALAAVAGLAGVGAMGAWAGHWVWWGPQIERLQIDIDAAKAANRIAKAAAEGYARGSQARIDQLRTSLRAAKRNPAISDTRACLTADELRVLVLPGSGDRGAQAGEGAGRVADPAAPERDVSARDVGQWIETCATRHAGLAEIIRSRPDVFDIER